MIGRTAGIFMRYLMNYLFDMNRSERKYLWRKRRNIQTKIRRMYPRTTAQKIRLAELQGEADLITIMIHEKNRQNVHSNNRRQIPE